MCVQVYFELTCATSLFLLFPSLSELHKSAIEIIIFTKIIIIIIMKSVSPLTKPLPFAQKSRQKEKLLEIMF